MDDRVKMLKVRNKLSVIAKIVKKKRADIYGFDKLTAHTALLNDHDIISYFWTTLKKIN